MVRGQRVLVLVLWCVGLAAKTVLIVEFKIHIKNLYFYIYIKHIPLLYRIGEIDVGLSSARRTEMRDRDTY